MKSLSLVAISLVLFISCNEKQTTKSLFDGESLNGWFIDVPEMDTVSSTRNPFIVRNKMLVSLGTPGGHLITDASYENYRVNLEYRFAGKPGNCGALVHVSKDKMRRLYAMFPQSLEVQLKHTEAGDFWLIGEDLEVPNMVERRGPKEKWGVDGDKNRRIPNLTGNVEKKPGEWNYMQIECLANEIKVWINGKLVNHGFNATASNGSFALQSEGSEVEFRKVELTPITKLSN
ncbi:hypothetical protein GGR42_001687 [Saonia flava]|uniref:3-keto-alpha-glucoside-1,2-lyase/3-keto-2-hydroxy-glucal hydratase domain-containing protein n=1 Tax=Saonia flava TaxID=523696 RepID=A0A846QZY4_9FLAO|nr:DUF1080 domain-containing protein [Saonia flava]NJB71225.1 hypothetical protein [Saonia flava]